MTDAYHDCEGVGHSNELEMYNLIKEFGAQNVLGRVLYAREMMRMYKALTVKHAYQARYKSENWAEWANKNKDAAELLAHVETLLNG